MISMAVSMDIEDPWKYTLKYEIQSIITLRVLDSIVDNALACKLCGPRVQIQVKACDRVVVTHPRLVVSPTKFSMFDQIMPPPTPSRMQI